VWKQISNEEYHSEYRNYLSSSDLRRLLRSPAHYRAPSTSSTPAQEIGTLAHMAILEPYEWKTRCQPSPKIDRRTKEGKALADWQASQETERGIKFISEDVYSQIESIAASVQSSVGTSGLLTEGVAELSGFTSLLDCNIRVRPDYLKHNCIVDLKTTQDARPEPFVRSVMQYGYDVQAALYLDACEAIDGKKRDFIWIAVEKDAPYGVQIFKASESMLARGRSLYQQAIRTYLICSAFDYWPGYTTAIQTLNLPKWAQENL
jgi:exodeoxyribonuclease VIII